MLEGKEKGQGYGIKVTLLEAVSICFYILSNILFSLSVHSHFIWILVSISINYCLTFFCPALQQWGKVGLGKSTGSCKHQVELQGNAKQEVTGYLFMDLSQEGV